jgi:Histidine phosphatase superfamily (branch 1)
MFRRDFLAVAAGGALLSACAARPPALHGRLIVLRHADRTFSMLNETGVERADRLPEAVADLPIDAVCCTPRPRNIATATPLAVARGLPVRTLDARGVGTRMLTDYPGQTVAWIGNQENLPFLYSELGIPHRPPVQFGQIHIVTLPANGAIPQVELRDYGVA